MGDHDDDGTAIAYKWEQGIQASWETVQEDSEGHIISTVTDRERSLRAKRSRLTTSIRRGLIRYLVLIIDCSLSATEKDYRPCRLEACKLTLHRFVSEFFDQNPISQVGIGITRDRIAERLTDLTGNPKAQQQSLGTLTACRGLASLQNAVNLSISMLKHVPNYGHREVLILFNSLSTNDPGNIFGAIEAAKTHKLRVSVICLVAELFICRQLAELTGGTFSVALDTTHLQELLSQHTIPPPEILQQVDLVTDFVYMGFPKRSEVEVMSFEGKRAMLSKEGYICPRCTTRTTDIPTQCMVCGLQLNSSSHIARSHHHLFPVLPFIEHTAHAQEDGEEGFYALPCETKPQDADTGRIVLRGKTARCQGCLLSFHRDQAYLLQCPACLCCFCVDCDLFIHDSLHNCPGCC